MHVEPILTDSHEATCHDWRLKPGYAENITRRSWEGDQAGAYWTPDRIRASADYQYDVYLVARELIDATASRAVIDVGPGPGTKAATLLGDLAAELWLVDQPTVESLAREVCPAAQFVAADLESISLDLGRAFDVCVCADVLEHLTDPSSCLDFVSRHCHQKSLVVFSTPERDFLHGSDCTSCEKPEHVREWNAREFAAVLLDFGFDVVRHELAPQIRTNPGRGVQLEPRVEPHRASSVPVRPDLERACQILRLPTGGSRCGAVATHVRHLWMDRVNERS